MNQAGAAGLRKGVTVSIRRRLKMMHRLPEGGASGWKGGRQGGKEGGRFCPPPCFQLGDRGHERHKLRKLIAKL